MQASLIGTLIAHQAGFLYHHHFNKDFFVTLHLAYSPTNYSAGLRRRLSTQDSTTWPVLWPNANLSEFFKQVVLNLCL